MGRSAARDVHRVMAKGILLPIHKQGLPSLMQLAIFCIRGWPDETVPLNAAGQRRQWNVATRHTYPSTESIRINCEPLSRQSLHFSKKLQQEGEQVVSGIAVPSVAVPRYLSVPGRHFSVHGTGFHLTIKF